MLKTIECFVSVVSWSSFLLAVFVETLAGKKSPLSELALICELVSDHC